METIFNEQSLRAEIAKTWGEHGAHMEVFDMLLKKALPQVEVSDQDLFVLLDRYFTDRVLTEIDYLTANDLRYDLDVKTVSTLRSILSQSKQEKWISVEEEYPKDFEDVLGLLESGDIVQCYFVDDVGGTKIMGGYKNNMGKITHWMKKPPLPPPPTKGK